MESMQKVNFIETDLEYNCFVWRMPKSNELFLIIHLNGTIEKNELNREKKYLINYLEKVKSLDYYFTTVLVDFSDVVFQNVSVTEILPEESNTIARNAGIIVLSNALSLSAGDYHFYECLEAGLSDFAYLNKKKRVDGGSKIINPQEVLKINNNISKYEIDIGNLKIELYKIPRTKNSFYLKIAGFYPRGSAGSIEGKFIGIKIREVMRDFFPEGLIMDFTELDYEWGDDIEIYPWQLKKIEKPLQFVFTESQLKFFSFKLKKDENRISFNVNDACKRLDKMIGK